MIPIVEEHQRALDATRFEELRPLIAAGVAWETILAVAPAFARINVAGAIYQPDREGGAAYVIPVRADNPLTPEAADPVETIRSGAIVDILAIHPRHPQRWAMRHGTAEWLGAIEPQYLDPEPVPIWRSPLRWLQAGCCGLVLLSEERESRYRTLSNLRSVVAEDHQHAVELRALLNHSWSGPSIATRETRRAA